ncbi:hypothetical protein AB0K60_22700 [Thermopolyspora sp. NPDC052614]|uniref:hypothetical protein n=1 Tax=Thermopolyspora sp. NPDC052614 TaxID=3155682 RepID=UPI00341F8303
MLVVLAVAALAVLGCVVAVALGHGGEMTEFPPDVPPLDLPEAGQLTAVDFMSLRLPVALVGYHTQTVDETLRRVATALSERDTRIAVLEQRVAELLTGRLQARQEVYAKPAKPPRTEHLPQPPRGEPTEALTEVPSGVAGDVPRDVAEGSRDDVPTDELPESTGGASGRAAGAEWEATGDKPGDPEKSGKGKDGAKDATLAKVPRVISSYDEESS